MRSPSKAWLVTTALVVTTLVIGCSGSSSSGLGGGGASPRNDAGAANGSETANTDSSLSKNETEQANGACPSRPKWLDGSAAAGESCEKGSDCEPTCCTCEEGAGEWLAASCVDGKCASASKACSLTRKPKLCGASSSPDEQPSKPAPPSLDQQCGKMGFVGQLAQACEDCWSTTCCAQKKWCADTPECGAYLSCRTTCPGGANSTACQQCREIYPVGATIIDGMVSCLGSSCDAACAYATMP